MRYMNEDFLLKTKQAKTLYHEFAADMPIIDYHCHLSPAEIAADKRWSNLAQVWLDGDHYKWRTMRSNGVPEFFCTGDAPDRDRFEKFAETMPYLLRNPMHHWSHLELARYFGIDDVLSPETSESIWSRSIECLKQPDMSARGLMLKSRVRLVCTTDDPADSLEHHRIIASDKRFSVKVLPTWRPDKGLAIERSGFWNGWVDRLGESADIEVKDLSTFMSALEKRHAFFSSCGCRLSDYGVSTVYAEPYTEPEISSVFDRARSGGVVTASDVRKFRSYMLFECMRMDCDSDWAVQIHYGALRNNNSRMFELLGPDSGFDSIGDWPVAEALSQLLDRLESNGSLSRMIVYTLNPRDNEMLGAMIGNFQGGGVPGRIQLGSGWWFNDQLDGMRRQIETVSQLGLLSRFVGMLTDSRSFLSYTRHEYFRRLLCNILGQDMVDGLIPSDIHWTGEVVKGICYNNAAEYFGFGLPKE